MILQKLINLLSKTHDSKKKCLVKHMISQKNHKFANEKWKGVNSEKIKVKTCFVDKDLSSWTGLGRSGHVQITTFGPISHVSDPKLSF